jgi:serine phosphatase RsbU (regulator of sigma subunit)
MASDIRKHPPANRASRSLAAVIVGVCLPLCLVSIPVAIARPDRGASTQGTTAPSQPSTTQQSGASSQGAHHDKVEAGAGVTSPDAEAPSKHSSGTDSKHAGAGSSAPSGAGAGQQQPAAHRKARQDNGQTTGGSQGSESPQEAGAKQDGGHQHDPAREHDHGRQPHTPRQHGAARGQSTESPEGSELLESTAIAPNIKKRQPGSGHKKEKEPKERTKERGKKGKTRSPQPPAVSGESPAPPKDVTAPLSGAAATAASASPVIAPATVTLAPGTGITAPSLSRRAPRAAKRADNAQGAGAGPLGSAALAPAIALSSTATAAAQQHPGGPHGAHRRSHRATTGSSPLVTTITKIVNVVPTPIRLLIAGLLALALALAVRSGVVALRARRLERQRAQLLEDVGLLQAALLPTPPARLGPVGTSVAYKPAAGPGAGGDFYDVFALEDGKLAVIVGDVSGHGRSALPHTALLRFTLRAYLEAGLSPRDAVQTAGAVLERQLGGLFATVVAATYQPRERVLVYSCAGHPPPVILGSRATDAPIAPVTACSSPPIGVGMRTGTRQTVVSVPGGAQICFYTDGVTEARVGNELFGTERLVEAINDAGPAATASAILDNVVQRTDARPDDMAACLLCVEGDDEQPSLALEELELDREEIASERTEDFLLACGLERDELADVIDSARVAAGRAGTAVLELRHGDRAPEVTLRRDHLAYLHLRRANMEVLR